MPRLLNLTNHSGGLKTNLSPFLYEKDESPNSKNVDTFLELGSVSKSTQYEQFSSDAGDTEIQGIMPFENVDGVTRIFMATGGTIYQDVQGTWTSRDTTLQNLENVESVVFYDRLYVSNELKQMRNTTDGITWNTSVLDEDSNSLDFRPKFVDVFRDRLYAANFSGGQAGQENRFAFSDLGDGTTFNTDNFIETIENPITGMKATFNAVYFFTDRSFWRWDGAYLLKIDNEGTESHRSLAAGNGRLFFANRSGVWMTTGGKAQFISRPVQKFWDGINPINFTKLNSIFFKNEYYLWVGDTDSETDVVLVYNTLHGKWRVLTNWPSNVMAAWTNSSQERDIYFGNNSTDSIVYKTADTHEQNQTKVESLYEYPALFPAGADKEVYGRTLHCFAESKAAVTFEIEYSLDDDNSFQKVGQWTLKGSDGIETIKFDLDNTVVGYSIRFRVKESNSNNAWKWHGMRYYFEPRRGEND